MTKEEIEQAEKFLDAYLGGNRNVSTLTWKHWIECLADYGKKLQSENERLKAEGEWILEFGNHLQAHIKVTDAGIEVIHAVNGWGDSVPLSEVKILPSPPKQ